MATAATIVKNIRRALANETSIEKNGQRLRLVATQLGYAGIEITAEQLTQALDAEAVACPSVFGPMPAVSTHYTSFGTEWRFRHEMGTKAKVFDCIQAVYAVTDTMPRTPQPVTLRDGSTIEIERIRPRAFARALGHLRVRWAQGNFGVPRPTTIRRWAAA